MTTAAQPQGLVGEILWGKYRVDAVIGEGGMGVVLQATHIHLDERVAIKMLRSDVPLQQEVVMRFVREAQAAVKLKGEHIARVSDVGTFDNGAPYMVMEFLDGVDVGKLLEEQKVLPIQLAVEIGMQVCEALAEAHSIGIVHRDIKPSNLFVTWRPDGSVLVKVLDFGISKSAHANDISLTQTSSTLGTPAYMSPEQMRSARMVDGRTDIWSLGAVMFELIHGQPPFDAETFSEMCVKVAVDAPAAPVTPMPPGLHEVLLKCLEKDSNARYATVTDFARDLSKFALDPAAAANAVERTARVSLRNVPRPVSEFASGPVSRVSQAYQEYQEARPDSANGATARPASGQHQYPNESAEPTVRRGKAWIWLVLAGVGAVTATGLFLTLGAGRSTVTANPITPVAIVLDAAPAVVPVADAAPTAVVAPDAATDLVMDPPAGTDVADDKPSASTRRGKSNDLKRPPPQKINKKKPSVDDLLNQRVPTGPR